MKKNILTETYTGKDFDNLIIAWLQTKQGKNYELIFVNDTEKTILKFGEKKEIVNKLENYFNKDFKPLLFEDVLCYSHTF